MRCIYWTFYFCGLLQDSGSRSNSRLLISNNLQPYLTFVMVYAFGVILSLFLDSSFRFWPQRTNTQKGRHVCAQLIEYIIDAENAYLIMLTSLNRAF